MSFTPLVTALSWMNSAFVASAIIFASVVFPVPGGPAKITDVRISCSIALRNGVPSPTISSCPEKSSSVIGRRRNAKGAEFSMRGQFYHVSDCRDVPPRVRNNHITPRVFHNHHCGTSPLCPFDILRRAVLVSMESPKANVIIELNGVARLYNSAIY